jgi:hypothetical protein
VAKDNASLLPNGPEDSVADDADVDYSNLRVNFSEEEASSEGRSFEPIPGGQYHVAITDIETRKVTSTEKGNQGKPFWNVTLTVQSGAHVDKKLWGSVMLFEGALYSFSQLMKSTGHADKYKEERENDGERYFKNEVKGYKSLGASSGSTSAGNTLMP